MTRDPADTSAHTAEGAGGPADTIDRIGDDAPMLDSLAIKRGRLDDTPEKLMADYLGALPPLPRVGDALADRWRIERLLGEGGFGAVFEGRDQQLGRKVAIKVLRAEPAPADAFALRQAITRMDERRRRFRDEARAVARAASENVVTVYDVGEHGEHGWPFLVLELVEGTPLDRFIRERAAPPSPEVVLHVLEQLVNGVRTLHERGVVHRDLKPANAMLTADGRVKIIDFGLAIAASDWTEVQGPKAPALWIEGTPVYMSPELTAGAEPDTHADLWALGVIAYELVAGRSPWGDGVSPAELERRIAHDEPPPLGTRATSDARWLAHLEPIISKMLAKRPADRFQSAAEVAHALASLRRETTTAPEKKAEPFRYLLAFEEKDAGWFFGREDVTAKLVLALEQRGRLVVAGPSGAGKTSLVQAGLIPELKVLRPLEVLRLQPGRDPLARLGAAADLTAAELRLQPGLFGERLRAHAKAQKRRVLVQVDALEELITQDAPAADVEVFGRALEGLFDDTARSVLLVMAVRDEYLGRLPRMSRALEVALRDAEFLGPPPRQAMIDALVRPVQRLRVAWQPGFPEEMVDAVQGQASPLPVLQLAASWVWEKRRTDLLERALLANENEPLRIGDVLGQYADHKLRGAAWTEADRELVKRMLPALVSAEGTPLVVPIDELLARTRSTRAAELLRDLVDFRLLTSLRDERGREALTPVHTTLIRGWSLMRDALAGTAELEAFLRRFERDAREWHTSQHDPAKLWPAAALREFERWAQRLAEVELSPIQRAFRDAVLGQARRATIIRWSLVALLALLALGGTWAGITFSNQAAEAEALRQDALGQKATAEQQTRLSEAHRREADELIDFMVGDLRERLEPIGQVKVLRSVAEKAIGYLDRRDAQSDLAPVDAVRRATVLRNLSFVFFEEGDTTQAEKTARAALEIAQQLAQDTPSQLTEATPTQRMRRREVALSLTSLGVVQYARGDTLGALNSYKAALVIYDALAALAMGQDDNSAHTPGMGDLTPQRDLMVIHDRIGDVLTSRGETDAALIAQESALAIGERLAAAAPDNVRLRRDLLVAHNKLAISLQAKGDLAGARARREASLPLAETAAADLDDAQAQRDLAVSRVALGDVLMLQGELGSALASYQVALAIDKRLAIADPTSANAQRDLSIAHNKVGDAKLYAADPAGALPEYQVSVAISERLAKGDPANVRFQQDYAHTLSRLGDARIALGDVEAGLESKVQMVAIVEALDTSLGTDLARVELAQTLANYANALRSAGQLDLARPQAERARTLLAPLLARPDPPPWWKGVDEWLETFLAAP